MGKNKEVALVWQAYVKRTLGELKKEATKLLVGANNFLSDEKLKERIM